MGIGRYSDYATFSVRGLRYKLEAGPRSDLGEVYQISYQASVPKIGGFGIEINFDPQGRMFDTDVSVKGAAKTAFSAIKVPLSSIRFQEDSVSLKVGTATKSYTLETLETEFVEDVENVGGNPTAAALVAQVLAAGITAMDEIGDVLVVNNVRFAPRDGFAKFVKVGDGIELPDDEFHSHLKIIDNNTVVLVGRPRFDETESDITTFLIYERDGTGRKPISELPAALAEFSDWPIEFILDEFFVFGNPGIAYQFDTSEAVQMAFESSGYFGADSNDDPVTINGTDADEIIDADFVDTDGDQITDDGQIIRAGGGDDVIHDGTGNDQVFGGAGDDKFFAGHSGQDTYDGGAGYDEVSYVNFFPGLTINTLDPTKSTDGAKGDRFVDIEALNGTEFDDVIISDVANIFGRGGNDRIQDATGAQILSGGAGADVFVFVAGDQEQDRIADFDLAEDKIDLSQWGVQNISELTIQEASNNQQNSLGWLSITYSNDSIRLEGLTMIDLYLITEDNFIFA